MLGLALCACGQSANTSQEVQNMDGRGSMDSMETEALTENSGNGRTGGSAMEINVWGDSMAEGYFWGDDVSYPSVLEELTGITTNNFGIRSEDSVEILTRSLEYGDQSGDVMIIQMGDNGHCEFHG